MNKNFWRRFLEILPGFMVWFSFVAPVVLSFIVPAAVATYVLIFDLFWIYKSLLFGINLIYGYVQHKRDLAIDWFGKLERLKNTDLDWKELYHVIIYPTYKEDFEILDSSIESVAKSNYPLDRVIIVLATEERAKEVNGPIAEELYKKYKNTFHEFLICVHPDGIVGENKAKGANVTWAAKKLRNYLDENKIDYEKVTVTTADSDSRLHRQYLACLTFKYVSEPDRLHSSFQPIPLYSNNIWQAPAISRIIAFGNSYWQMIEACRPWRMITFATHAMSMKTLIDINYWAVEVVNEDSRQFWRAYFKYDGKFKVVPMFVPIYMDAVLADSFWQTLKNQYLQKQRWAYGVEHFPYVVTESFKNRKIAMADKVVRIWRMFEGLYSWATASIFIAVVAWLPIIFGPGFRDTVLGANMMELIRRLMVLTWVGIAISIYLSLLLLPPRPQGYRRRRFIVMVLQWLLMPVQAIIFSSFPAIDAQTRLMLGKYMTFRVTEKKAISENIANT